MGETREQMKTAWWRKTIIGLELCEEKKILKSVIILTEHPEGKMKVA